MFAFLPVLCPPIGSDAQPSFLTLALIEAEGLSERIWLISGENT